MLPLYRQGVFGDGSDGKVYSTARYIQRPKHCSLVINKVQETTPHHHYHLYASSQDQFQNPSLTYISDHSLSPITAPPDPLDPPTVAWLWPMWRKTKIWGQDFFCPALE